jgi:GntR family transcriptional regulator
LFHDGCKSIGPDSFIEQYWLNMLNHQSPMPLYHQLAEIILARIRSGEYGPDSKIPSENTFSAEYGIGRPTVRQAVDLLVRRGLLTRRRGSGTFVRKKEKEVDLLSLVGTTSAFHSQGISVATRLLKPVRRLQVTPDNHNPFAGQVAYHFSRLSRVEQTPVLVEDFYLHPQVFNGIDRIDLTGRSLAEIVHENYYMRPIGGKQNFRIGYLSGRQAADLAVTPKTPILLVKRFLHFQPARNAIYSELFCRTDQFVFSQTIGGLSDEKSGLL